MTSSPRFQKLLTAILTISVLIPQLVLLPTPAFAEPAPDAGKFLRTNLDKVTDGQVGPDKAFPSGKDPGDVFKVANAAIITFFTILGLLFLGLMLYGGYNWMTAMGEEEKVTKAKETIIPAVIGLGILIAAYAITTFVISTIYGNAGT